MTEEAPARQTEETSRIDMLQSLRAVAAISVAAAHAIGDIKQLPNGVELAPLYYLGAAGVDLFFVISGFVMVYAGSPVGDRPGGWSEFLARRWARIAPLYWIVMLLYAGLQIWQGKWHVIQGDRIVSSALFWPHRAEDGSMLPFYGIGWTLNFEMFFYCVFAIGLLAFRGHAVPYIAAALCALVGAGLIAPLGHPLSYWADPIVLEFVLGMGIAAAYLRGAGIGAPLSILLIVAAVSSVVVGGCFGYVAPLPGEPGGSVAVSRFIAWGLPAAALVVAVTLGPASRLQLSYPIRLLGDASYSIYLLHPLVIILARPAIAAALDLSSSTFVRFWIALGGLLLVLSIICAISLATYRGLERPINERVRFALKQRALRNFAGV